VNGVSGGITGRKRKRNGGKGKDSGAGSRIADSKLGTGMSREMQRVIHEELDESHEIAFNDPDSMDLDDEDDQEESSALERLRRGSGNEEDKEVELVNGDDTAERKEVADIPAPNYWHTFKYRPILGLCLIGESSEGDIGPEVAIVERPIWEADLGPRYVGDQEWEKPGV
jgi:U3 small nucleolar RNA-associated protein 4